MSTPIIKEITISLHDTITDKHLSKNCLNAVNKKEIFTVQNLTDKTWKELETILTEKQILAEILDFVQNVCKLDFKKS